MDRIADELRAEIQRLQEIISRQSETHNVQRMSSLAENEDQDVQINFIKIDETSYSNLSQMREEIDQQKRSFEEIVAKSEEVNNKIVEKFYQLEEKYKQDMEDKEH